MKNALSDKRTFPRLETQCPVIYSLGTANTCYPAQLHNISATGMLLVTEEKLVPNNTITVYTRPGRNRLVPAIMGKGLVLRCNRLKTGKFEVSCKLTSVKPQTISG